MRVLNCGKWMVCADLEEASQIIRSTINHHFMGSTDWYSNYKQNGLVFEGNRQIAKISYNGRIWPEGSTT